jgi:heat shock protein HtpX
MNLLKTSLLIAPLFGLFMGLGSLLGGQNGLILGFGLALATNFFTYWFSDKMPLAMSGAQPVDERQAPGLYRLVARLAHNANLPMPRVYLIPGGQPNAFATGRNPKHAAVAVTEGLLRMLSTEELEGVVAHELAHIKNRDIVISSIAATMGGAISFVAQMLQFQSLFGANHHDEDDGGANPLSPRILIGQLAGIIIAPIAAFLIQMAISRTREYDADRRGAQICGNPMALARALRKIEYTSERMPMTVNPAASHMYIVNPLGGDALQSLAALFRTHPMTADRVARLEEMAAQQRGASRQRRPLSGVWT